MFRIERRLMVLPAALLLVGACQKPRSSSDVHMARIEGARASFGTYFRDMSDNAILHDGTIADVHFIPHTSELSGLGVERLDRMARLLDTYGGTVRYQSDTVDEALVKERLDHVREYLTLTGCDMARVKVAVAQAGSIGMPGDEAVRKFNDGTAVKADAAPTAALTGGQGSGTKQ